ncbi:helix-turn-helix domain-containing protein [Kitasatospora sp. NBC_00240]|uniref:helix-turn-helix domain-containing protein n=1 Tax=Kitasatospora sp. NBC_00240 TaxID=2903567 RepID=UPI002258E512|nr:helix-turn-helix transcriptional regulator [Kitasatospora sp. NBC_00240]MCX5213001.1 helix-turn-helix domain-containing protein [Kitasatospora sp. NBC_00240]
MTEDKKTSLGPTGHRLRANVTRLRTALGMSKKDLSDRVGELGRPIPPLGITRLEAGTRRVDADDLIALSVALGVNPSTLLLPFTDEADEEVEITAIGWMEADRAWDWLDGAAPAERIEPGDPQGRLLRWEYYARPAGRRMQFGPAGEGD